METLAQYLKMSKDPKRFKIASKVEATVWEGEDISLATDSLASFLAYSLASLTGGAPSTDFGFIDSLRLLLECKTTRDIILTGSHIPRSSLSIAVIGLLDSFISLVENKGLSAIRGDHEDYLLKLLMSASDLSSILPREESQYIFSGILSIEGLSRDLVTYAGMGYVNCLPSHESLIPSLIRGDQPWPVISRLAVLRALVSTRKVTLESDFSSILKHFISFLPPAIALDAAVIHFALQSLVVCLTRSKSALSDAETLAITNACIACFEHPVGMVGAQAQSLFSKLADSGNATKIFVVISNLAESRARNYLLLPLVDYLSVENFDIQRLLKSVIRRTPISASAANLLQALSRKFLVDLDLSVVLDFLRTGDDPDFLFSAICGCDERQFKRLISVSVHSLSPVERLPICVFARSRNLLTWGNGLIDAAGALYLSLAEIKCSLASEFPAVALNAFSVLCYSLKTTGPLSQDEIDCVSHFVSCGGFLTCALSGPAVRTKVTKAFEFVFQRIRDSKSVCDLEIATPLTKLFNYAFRLALIPGASAEASLAAVELLQLLFSMFGPEGCELKGSRMLKGCGIGQSLGFFSNDVISDLLNFGITRQWETTRSAFFELLLTLPAASFPPQITKDFEETVLPRLYVSDKSSDYFKSGAIARILQRSDAGFAQRMLLNVETQSKEVHAYLAMLRGCLPATGWPLDLLSKTLEIAVSRSQTISEDIEGLLDRNEIEGTGLFTTGRNVVVDCRGHSETTDEDNSDWLTVREALLTFSELMDSGSISTLMCCTQSILFVGMSTEEKVADRIGTILLLLLLSVKHIGAIAGLQTAVTAFTKYVLTRQDTPSLASLPKLWLERITSLISNPGAQSALRLPPALRRSHGLGHGVTSLLQAEVDLSLARNSRIGRYACSNMDGVVSKLCQTSEAEGLDEDSKVHALNVLMTIAKHSSLSVPLDSYLGRLLTLSTSCMRRHDSWKIRTAGNLLFVQVSRRLVGTDNEAECNTKSITCDELFSRFPGFFDELMSLMVAEEAECALVALLIFLKLSGLERVSWSHASKDRLLTICGGTLLGSKALHVRKLAARLVLRLFKGQEAELSEWLVNWVSRESLPANQVHGILLVISGLPPQYQSVAGWLNLDKYIACGPIVQVASSLKDGYGFKTLVQPVYSTSGFTRDSDLSAFSPQLILQTLLDTSVSAVSKSGLADHVVNAYSDACRDSVIRELILASLPFTVGIDAKAFSLLYFNWSAVKFDEGLRALVEPKFKSMPGFAALVAACAANLEDTEARVLAAQFADLLTPHQRLLLLLDESYAVRGLASLPSVNLIQSAVHLLRQLTDAEIVNLVLACAEDKEEDVHSEKWLLPQLLASELLLRKEVKIDTKLLHLIESDRTTTFHQLYTVRLFLAVVGSVTGDCHLPKSLMFSDDVNLAVFLAP